MEAARGDMHDSTHFIFGYGVPEDIATDWNYNTYLRVAFNHVFETQRQHGGEVTVAFCGGPTDMREPYDRTEAGEMKRLFSTFSERPFVNAEWRLVELDEGLSTLEDLLAAKQHADEQDSTNAYIYCEFTRWKRVDRLAQDVFGTMNVTVVPIDFDHSQSRYHEADFLEQREQRDLEFERWSLKSKENLAEHHALHEEKLKRLREAGPEHHQDALKAWWEERIASSVST